MTTKIEVKSVNEKGKMQVCIIGGVAGGATAAARLRRLSEKLDITIIERGEFISFANCGLPYHISDTISNREQLILQSPAEFAQKFNLQVLTQHEVIKINRLEKKLLVKDLSSNPSVSSSSVSSSSVSNSISDSLIKEIKYDKLIFAPGARPIIPTIDGISLAQMEKEIFTLRNIPDMDAIKNYLEQHSINNVLLIGGGLIGVELAENLRAIDVNVHLVELSNQILAPFDYEMANLLHTEMSKQGVELYLSHSIHSLNIIRGKHSISSNKSNEMKSNAAKPEYLVTLERIPSFLEGLKEGQKEDQKIDLKVDMIISAIGVRPEIELAKEAGITLGASGGVKVNESQLTSDPDIYAVGDVVEIDHYIDNSPALIPLAGPANKQARVAVDHMMGLPTKYNKTQGTSIVKVFNLTAACTGINEKYARKKNIPYKTISTHPLQHAGYYPNAMQMSLKLLYQKESGKILGAQAVGVDGVDKRIDVLATAIRGGLTAYELMDLELAYAPPYGSAKDPINMLGYIANNIKDGLTNMASVNELYETSHLRNGLLIDVRTPEEHRIGAIENSINIPLSKIRQQISEIKKIKESKNAEAIVVYCRVGIRGYLAERILRENGVKEVYNLSGGYMSYKEYRPVDRKLYSVTSGDKYMNHSKYILDSKSVSKTKSTSISINHTLDLCGMQCPGPIMAVSKKLQTMAEGEQLQVKVTDPGFGPDLQAFCYSTGNTLISIEEINGSTLDSKASCAGGQDLFKCDNGTFFKAMVVKGGERKNSNVANNIASCLASIGNNQKTLIVFSNDLDRALATFIIANGARAMGSEVTLFFTFWGLNILRKKDASTSADQHKIKKNFLEKMFGIMMPKGSNELKLSKLNMLGMGTSMMKYVMKNKKVEPLDGLIEHAINSGVRLIACSMSMDIMGIKKEELIPGIEIGGVATYLNMAEKSNLNLFI